MTINSKPELGIWKVLDGGKGHLKGKNTHSKLKQQQKSSYSNVFSFIL